jgi:hypothetical protein
MRALEPIAHVKRLSQLQHRKKELFEGRIGIRAKKTTAVPGETRSTGLNRAMIG